MPQDRKLKGGFDCIYWYIQELKYGLFILFGEVYDGFCVIFGLLDGVLWCLSYLVSSAGGGTEILGSLSCLFSSTSTVMVC